MFFSFLTFDSMSTLSIKNKNHRDDSGKKLNLIEIIILLYTYVRICARTYVYLFICHQRCSLSVFCTFFFLSVFIFSPSFLYFFTPFLPFPFSFIFSTCLIFFAIFSSFFLIFLLSFFSELFASYGYTSISVFADLGPDSRTGSRRLCTTHKHNYSIIHYGTCVRS